jgi:hypothetical protein
MILVQRTDGCHQQISVPSMYRSLTTLTFAACLIPIAACSMMQGPMDPSGRADFEPVYCDPLGSDSAGFMALAVTPLDGVKIYSWFGPASRMWASAGSRLTVG